MMNLPDSGWLTVIRKLDLWILAAFAVAAAVVLALTHFNAPWFGQLSPTPALVIGGAGILFFCLFLFRSIELIYHAVKRSRRSKVRRRFDQLSGQQKEFLLTFFQRGSRDFVLPESSSLPRWLEELKIWNYIDLPDLLFAQRNYCNFTEAGWQQLEKHQGRSN